MCSAIAWSHLPQRARREVTAGGVDRSDLRRANRPQAWSVASQPRGSTLAKLSTTGANRAPNRNRGSGWRRLWLVCSSSCQTPERTARPNLWQTAANSAARSSSSAPSATATATRGSTGVKPCLGLRDPRRMRGAAVLTTHPAFKPVTSIPTQCNPPPPGTPFYLTPPSYSRGTTTPPFLNGETSRRKMHPPPRNFASDR